jgi:cytochrome P450
MVIKEALRLYPPAWGFGRMAAEDTDIGGYTVPKGALVSVMTYFMHHDPKWWPEPERFMPERFSPENEARLHKHAYLPFGGGPRICIGNSFAMMEARLILATAASRYRLKLAPGQTVEMQPLITLNPKGGLPMRLEARQPQTIPPLETHEAAPA